MVIKIYFLEVPRICKQDHREKTPLREIPTVNERCNYFIARYTPLFKMVYLAK